jgi:LacI family transcriptional regulator
VGVRVTIAEIARQAGVSVPTVSKVLNGHADVADDTRSTVQRLLLENNYRRRTAMRRSRAGLVDLVVPNMDSPWVVEVIRGAEDAAHQAGVGVVVSAVHGRRRDVRQWLDGLVQRRSDGVVLVVSELDTGERHRLAALEVPLVLVDPVGQADPDIPTVGATNWAGGLAATEHLTALGHRRIGIITGPPSVLCSQARLDGYRAGLERAGIAADPELIRAGDFLHDSGVEHGGALLDLADPPTAIFAGSDLQAFGVYDAARARRLRVPDDLSVVGFDDLALCAWVTPPLTTVRQPLAEMAAMAMRLALTGGADSPGASRVELATTLVVRDSTAPLTDRIDAAAGIDSAAGIDAAATIASAVTASGS